MDGRTEKLVALLNQIGAEIEPSEFEKEEDEEQEEATPVERVSEENFDFEKQLEESLKDL